MSALSPSRPATVRQWILGMVIPVGFVLIIWVLPSVYPASADDPDIFLHVFLGWCVPAFLVLVVPSLIRGRWGDDT